MNNQFLGRIDRQLEYNEMVRHLAHYLHILTAESKFYAKKAIEKWENKHGLHLDELFGHSYGERWVHLKEIGSYYEQNLTHLNYNEFQIEQALHIATTSLDLLYRI